MNCVLVCCTLCLLVALTNLLQHSGVGSSPLPVCRCREIRVVQDLVHCQQRRFFSLTEGEAADKSSCSAAGNLFSTLQVVWRSMVVVSSLVAK